MQLGERFQESFLGRFLGLAAIPEKSMRDMENSGAVAPNNFRECRLIFRAGLSRQFEIGRLFVNVRQKRSLGKAPAERGGDGGLDSCPNNGRSRAPTGSATNP